MTAPVLRELFTLYRARIGFALALAVGVACWSSSLTNHLGFGASLISAVVFSPLACVVGSGLAQRVRSTTTLTVTAAECALTAVLYALGVTTLALTVVFSHGLVSPVCDPGQGITAALLIALPGPALAALVGVCLGAMIDKRWVATLFASLVVPGFIAWSVLRFYLSPAVFAYDPFFGFWPGALYDETVPLGLSHVTYRLGTAGWFIALAGFLHLSWRPVSARARLSTRTLCSSAPALAITLAGLALGLGIYLAGPTLGHRLDADEVSSQLGATAWSRRCVVRFDRGLSVHLARLTAHDCDFRVAQLEEFFGVRHPQRVTVFLFANASQKRALMGAADTYIAKPWRHEVYLQALAFPHPVLKHELAHVIAGAMSSGFLRLPTHATVLPLPGLIEGAAVAAAWQDSGDLTPHEWSRAMLEVGRAPSVRSLTGLGFLAAASVTAYTAAGSFCRWLHDTHGAARFRRVYDTGDFTEVYGQSLAALEAQWHGFLRTVPITDAVLFRARTRFGRAAIFGRSCPLTLEALTERAESLTAAGDLANGRALWSRIIALDPTGLRARSALAESFARAGALSEADRVCTESTRVLGPAAGARVSARVVDTLWRWRSAEEARRRFDTVDLRFASDDELRGFDIRRRALASGGDFGVGARDLLVGSAELGPSIPAALPRLARVMSTEPFAGYLVARQAFNADRFAEALSWLDLDALSRAGSVRVYSEATRLAAVASYHTREFTNAARLFRSIADDTTRPRGARDEALDWLDRIARE